MKRTKITSAIVALAIAAALGTSAHAQVAGYSEGQLLIGFEQQNGSGGVTSNDYVVNLGNASNFIGATTPLTFNLSTSDLVSAFGTSWANNTPAGSLVQWGVAGGSDENGPITVGSDTLKENTLFYTLGEKNVGTKTTSPATASNSTQENINGNIQQFALDYQSTSPGVGGSIIPTSDSSGWSTLGSPSSTGFGSGKNIEQPASGSYTGPTNSQLDLYQLNDTTDTPGTKAIYLGDFTLSGGGVLTFDPAAVPEPSAYAMGAIAAALFLVLRRRKAISVQ